MCVCVYEFQFISISIYYTCTDPRVCTLYTPYTLHKYTYTNSYVVAFDQNFELMVFPSLFNTLTYTLCLIPPLYGRMHNCITMKCVCYDDNNLMSIYIFKLNM